jgi:hypothetical protein
MGIGQVVLYIEWLGSLFLMQDGSSFFDATFFCIETMDLDSFTPGLQTICVVSSQELSYLQMRNLLLRNVWHYTANQLSCTILFD